MLQNFTTDCVAIGHFICDTHTGEGAGFITNVGVGTGCTSCCIDQRVAKVVTGFQLGTGNGVSGCAAVAQIDVGFVIVELTTQYELPEVIVVTCVETVRCVVTIKRTAVAVDVCLANLKTGVETCPVAINGHGGRRWCENRCFDCGVFERACCGCAGQCACCDEGDARDCCRAFHVLLLKFR